MMVPTSMSQIWCMCHRLPLKYPPLVGRRIGGSRKLCVESVGRGLDVDHVGFRCGGDKSEWLFPQVWGKFNRIPVLTILKLRSMMQVLGLALTSAYRVTWYARDITDREASLTKGLVYF